MPPIAIDPLIAAAVVVATACTDAVYVLFTNAVLRRRRLPAASWSSIWYLLSSFAVINYTQHWSYVLFEAAGSFIGAFVTITFLHPGPTYPTQPPGSSPALVVARHRPSSRVTEEHSNRASSLSVAR